MILEIRHVVLSTVSFRWITNVFSVAGTLLSFNRRANKVEGNKIAYIQDAFQF